MKKRRKIKIAPSLRLSVPRNASHAIEKGRNQQIHCAAYFTESFRLPTNLSRRRPFATNHCPTNRVFLEIHGFTGSNPTIIYAKYSTITKVPPTPPMESILCIL
jgi:hypothetical protein